MKNKLLCLMLVIGMVFMGITSVAFGAGTEFPTKPIQFICPWPGGALFMAMRVLGEAASEILGKPVSVIDKPGAGGSIAAEYVAKAKPDGYTLFIFNSGSNGTTLVTRKVSYTNADFEIFCQAFVQQMILVTHKNAPWNSLEEFVAYAKKHPGEVKYATSGIATSSHLGMELFNTMAGVKTIHLPFLGGAELNTALVGGHVPISLYYYATLSELIKAGELKVLAQATEKRTKRLPDIPTFVEKGYPELVFFPWYGVAGPKGIPKEISDKLKDAFSKASQDKKVMEGFEKLGWDPYYRPAEDFTKFVNEFEEKIRNIVRVGNIAIK